MNDFDVPDPPNNPQDKSTKHWNNYWNLAGETLSLFNERPRVEDEPDTELCQRPDCLMPLPHEHFKYWEFIEYWEFE